MGPLMDVKHPNCLKLRKNSEQWSKYVHGASAIFAWRIAKGEEVTLLSPPPPERFHPSGLSYYQVIEEPIIRGLFGQNAVHKINIVHPLIKESDEFFYELWPNDRSNKWVERFGLRACKMKWRQHLSSTEEFKNFEQHKPTETSRQGASCEMKARVKSQKKAAKKIKNEKKACTKRQKKAAKKIKREKKAHAKAQQEAIKKLKDEKNTSHKTQQEAGKKIKREKKAHTKAQQEAAKN
ncbi:actin-like protein 10 [Penicillium brevicompactum]|uniref:actin-like protein 10 n=1 Tax=Penicillium brevicompactum TaxID=5074 RepID=UPI00253FE200|nr:actin-like protein 10 [Penicillium brevicompactum]KAJ5348627.1 actin-like protein 10 [Penicillium brevicompactum]